MVSLLSAIRLQVNCIEIPLNLSNRFIPIYANEMHNRQTLVQTKTQIHICFEVIVLKGKQKRLQRRQMVYIISISIRFEMRVLCEYVCVLCAVCMQNDLTKRKKKWLKELMCCLPSAPRWTIHFFTLFLFSFCTRIHFWIFFYHFFCFQFDKTYALTHIRVRALACIVRRKCGRLSARKTKQKKIVFE